MICITAVKLRNCYSFVTILVTSICHVRISDKLKSGIDQCSVELKMNCGINVPDLVLITNFEICLSKSQVHTNVQFVRPITIITTVKRIIKKLESPYRNL